MNDIFYGNYCSTDSYKTCDKEQLLISTSGGVVTTLVKQLLASDEYSVAFLVDDYNYEKYIEVREYRKSDNLHKTPKSRYVPVSQANMLRYCITHRKEKVIIVATGCVVESFSQAILQNKLNRDNYFIIGLFCNATMNYNIWKYFNKKMGNSLKNLYFRAKEGKPYFYGSVKLVDDDGRVKYMNPGKRMLLKPYMTMEKCIYCIDKLNVLADISVGDEDVYKRQGLSPVNICKRRGRL